MVARRVALVPTVMQLNNFPDYADGGGGEVPARTPSTCSTCTPAGATRSWRPTRPACAIYAGTDAGGVLPHGLIASEVRELADYGFSAEAALGAASWRAREWLGLDGRLSEGTTADFVVFDRDPLRDLSVLAEPKRIVLRGRVVG